jgi:hypothetical protein
VDTHLDFSCSAQEETMTQMKKLDIATLKSAYAGPG